MAELADAPVLGTGPYGCRFDPCHPHQKSEGRDFRIFLSKSETIGEFGTDVQKKALASGSKQSALPENPAAHGFTEDSNSFSRYAI